MTFPRLLSAREETVAWNLLEGAGAPELDILAGQLNAARVTSKCECLCPTISMSVDASRSEPVSYSGKPVATADYDGGGIMVWIEDAWLSHLEMYWCSETAPTEFPDGSHLTDHRLG